MTNLELRRYNGFLLLQNKLTRRGVIQPIYRGDSLENLCHKLNVEFNGKSTDIETLLHRLFIVGEKAQRFYTDSENFRIEEADDYVFERILKYYKESLKSKNKDTLLFFKKNKKFTDFFSNKNNKQIFLSKIKDTTSSEKIYIRNYYLILLHQLAAINYKRKSHFVSTSKDYEMAEMFSKGKHRNKHRIILHCWYPEKAYKGTVKRYDLPTYSFHPYQYQREYSVLGGILPHYISGIELVGSGDFYPNPNIFTQGITISTFLDGININQEYFYETVSLTNYKRALTTDGDNTWENCIQQ